MGWGAGVSAVAAVLGTSYSVYSGERSNRAQKAARQDQQQAQNRSLLDMASQRRENDIAAAAAKAKAPNVDSLLASSDLVKTPGLLAGKLGVDSSLLTLGRPKLLGE